LAGIIATGLRGVKQKPIDAATRSAKAAGVRAPEAPPKADIDIRISDSRPLT